MMFPKRCDICGSERIIKQVIGDLAFRCKDCRNVMSVVVFDQQHTQIAPRRKSLNSDPEYAVTWNNKGIALGNLNRYKEAVSNFNKALKLDPEDVSALVNKGVVLNSLGRYEEAIVAYDEAVKLDPKNMVAWFNRGFILSDLGRYEEAVLTNVINVILKRSHLNLI